MNETEYLASADLARVRMALSILGDVTTPPADQLTPVRQALAKMADDLFAVVHSTMEIVEPLSAPNEPGWWWAWHPPSGRWYHLHINSDDLRAGPPDGYQTWAKCTAPATPTKDAE